MTESPRRLSLSLWCAAVLAVLVALLPWWRNHSYLRDLYDYGLVLTANGHLDLGERPYVDFTTPIQAGFLGLNWLVERAGGGTYFALTLGGAGLIVVTGLVLVVMLARRWPWWAAGLVGGAVTVAGAAQHTILWHNSLGLSCLAVVAWAAACAPVLRRATWPWHALMGAGLLLGGINKLNFHLVAVAAALAWAVRAGLLRQAGGGRVGATGAGILLAGVVLPVAGEMAWTGASLSLWLANVVQLAAGSRLEILRKVFSPDFLLRPIHDYYGTLPLPQVGLVGAWLSLAALAGCWPGRSGANGAARGDRWLVPLAVVLAGAAAAALLATNYEIASIGLGAWLVLAVSLWLGFSPAGRRAVFLGGVIVPAVLLGGAAWWSAWLGQRSQFGFSDAPRSAYRPAESAGPAFARLAGLRLPPELVRSLEVVEQSLPEPDPEEDTAGLRPVFYGPGLEFLQRFLPGPWEKGQPLWGHWNTTYSPAHLARLGEKFGEGRGRAVLVVEAFDSWPPEIRARLEAGYARDHVGPAIIRWFRRDKDYVNLDDSFAALARLGGNVDGQLLHFDRNPLWPREGADGRLLLGTTRPAGSMLLRTPTYRIRGEAVLERLPAAGNGPLSADFRATIHGSIPEEVRWSARLELPAGRQSVSVPFEADAGGRPLLLWVTQPAEKPAGALGGFRGLEITHAVEADGAPLLLRRGGPADGPATPELAASLFGSVAWRPQRLVVRGSGSAAAGGLEVPAGGELWLHTDNMTGELRGQLSRAGASGPAPVVRVVWYKGGRLQLMQQGQVPADRPFDFRVWTAEPGGWIGLLVDRGEGVAPVQARVTGSTLVP